MEKWRSVFSYKHKNDFEKHTNVEKLCISTGEMYLTICVEWPEDI